MRETGFTAVEEHPGVVGVELRRRVQVLFRGLVARQFQVDFAELQVERHLVGFRVRAFQKARVRVLQIPFQQVRLPFEVGQLRFLSVRSILLASTSKRRHEAASTSSRTPSAT